MEEIELRMKHKIKKYFFRFTKTIIAMEIPIEMRSSTCETRAVNNVIHLGARPDAKVEFDFSDKGFPFAPTLKLT